MCSAWFLDIRIPTCFKLSLNMVKHGVTNKILAVFMPVSVPVSVSHVPVYVCVSIFVCVIT